MVTVHREEHFPHSQKYSMRAGVFFSESGCALILAKHLAPTLNSLPSPMLTNGLLQAGLQFSCSTSVPPKTPTNERAWLYAAAWP